MRTLSPVIVPTVSPEAYPIQGLFDGRCASSQGYLSEDVSANSSLEGQAQPQSRLAAQLVEASETSSYVKELTRSGRSSS